MAIHRIAEGFRRQDWVAVTIEFASVLAGVLIGVQLSNWNDERRHQTQVRQVIGRLLPEFREGAAEQPYLQHYYANREALGRRAEALWNEPGRDDEFFASAFGTGSYAAILDFDRDANEMRIGRDTVSQIDDDNLRDSIAALLGHLGNEYLRFSYVDTDFRRTVRRLVPSEIQQRYVKQCNSVGHSIKNLEKLYSASCKLDVAPEVIHRLAAAIRADPAALGQLREHINRLATLNNRMDIAGLLYKNALVQMDKDRAVSGR